MNLLIRRTNDSYTGHIGANTSSTPGNHLEYMSPANHETGSPGAMDIHMCMERLAASVVQKMNSLEDRLREEIRIEAAKAAKASTSSLETMDADTILAAAEHLMNLYNKKVGG